MIRRADEINQYMKELEDLIEIHPVPDMIKGMVEMCAWALYGDCDKPKHMSDKKWKRFKEQCQEDKDRRNKKMDILKRNANPTDIRDVLINPNDLDD